MGKRGKKPLPKEILALRGSRRGNPTGLEPQVDRANVTAPEWLDPDAVLVWDQLAPQLLDMGCLARIDAHALGRYCEMFVRWRRAEVFIRENGESYPLKDSEGSVKCWQQFPQVAIAHRLSLALTKIEAEFGMTPSSRSRIVVGPSSRPKNNITAFLAEASA